MKTGVGRGVKEKRYNEIEFQKEIHFCGDGGDPGLGGRAAISPNSQQILFQDSTGCILPSHFRCLALLQVVSIFNFEFELSILY